MIRRTPLRHNDLGVVQHDPPTADRAGQICLNNITKAYFSVDLTAANRHASDPDTAARLPPGMRYSAAEDQRPVCFFRNKRVQQRLGRRGLSPHVRA